ncbi:uncharacterized protein F4807DRAFT_435174 [Annulohypoxylon truncatum]|uniref:uncharacterized protein n=1 Tax=Annulohypoxylon truncatum TaxID=327061 RepID=UPI0020075CDA|nr:uncharacterized protein F4807DRAFT_435174 [Annulohypoxylon truncatum]KAI1207286.1 hypothetical protein F4807DRAFT_435174 [Annulohypoxylon truncatum]
MRCRYLLLLLYCTFPHLSIAIKRLSPAVSALCTHLSWIPSNLYIFNATIITMFLCIVYTKPKSISETLKHEKHLSLRPNRNQLFQFFHLYHVCKRSEL